MSDDDDLPLGPPLELLRRIWRLNHAIELASTRMERALGVSASQRFVIRCVGRYPGMTAGRLASLLHVDRGTVSTALNRLEEKGLLVRRKDPRDGRRVTLGLTAQGRALDRPTEGTVEDAVDRLLRTAGADEVVTMTALLERLSALLEDESTARS